MNGRGELFYGADVATGSLSRGTGREITWGQVKSQALTWGVLCGNRTQGARAEGEDRSLSADVIGSLLSS